MEMYKSSEIEMHFLEALEIVVGKIVKNKKDIENSHLFNIKC